MRCLLLVAALVACLFFLSDGAHCIDGNGVWCPSYACFSRCTPDCACVSRDYGGGTCVSIQAVESYKRAGWKVLD
jgi:hypothetical protein